MPADLKDILAIEVPVIVQIAERGMTMREVVNLTPGSIVELPKEADDELELCVNNQTIGTGTAVKVGENFGIRVAYIGDVAKRMNALKGAGKGANEDPKATPAEQSSDESGEDSAPTAGSVDDELLNAEMPAPDA